MKKKYSTKKERMRARRAHRWLVEASETGDLARIDRLLSGELQKMRNEPFDGVGFYYGATPLIVAAKNGQLQAAERLLAHGAKVDFSLVRSKYSPAQDAGNTALWYAVAHEHLDLMELLLDAGADPSLPFQKPLLFWAVERQSTELARVLLEAGAPHDQRMGMHSLLDYQGGPNQKIRRLLRTFGFKKSKVKAPYSVADRVTLHISELRGAETPRSITSAVRKLSALQGAAKPATSALIDLLYRELPEGMPTPVETLVSSALVAIGPGSELYNETERLIDWFEKLDPQVLLLFKDAALHQHALIDGLVGLVERDLAPQMTNAVLLVMERQLVTLAVAQSKLQSLFASGTLAALEESKNSTVRFNAARLKYRLKKMMQLKRCCRCRQQLYPQGYKAHQDSIRCKALREQRKAILDHMVATSRCVELAPTLVKEVRVNETLRLFEHFAPRWLVRLVDSEPQLPIEDLRALVDDARQDPALQKALASADDDSLLVLKDALLAGLDARAMLAS